ncbi:sigma-70 family RNA polymerase sigma factor [Actinomadura nitritigenes]|uniref:Sigma-70 family RNA polymerase sigma factor n=1 Tax=Actinomadura nitritigenes TaxID=134602 RepID=A0ABS3RFD4_9ACTN|nr:sigma-70 family RNA polymerase sigma factor [Actinomadura nitritigenes]MBO2444856.1 sigma-70 family RNA polymerase sigma factor [Actinomadura nitritigenes]
MRQPSATTQSGEDFARLADPYRPELLAYCYRMLGSVHDAEDLVQEILLRAWQAYGGFEGRASLRTWLYRIATNTCLRALENRVRRPLPSGLSGPAEDPDAPASTAMSEVPWLQPIPETLYGANPADPASVVASRAGMRLALIAALQYLPPRQRAVLILRDVLRWQAPEVARLLGVSAAAVNSLLQRARAQLGHAALSEDDIAEPTDPQVRGLLDRYAAAFQTADVAALMRLLTADAVYEMPPIPIWFAGRRTVGRFLEPRLPESPADIRVVPASANGQPALATYRRGRDGMLHAHSIQVLTIEASLIARVTSFQDPALFATFGLPDALPTPHEPTMD